MRLIPVLTGNRIESSVLRASTAVNPRAYGEQTPNRDPDTPDIG